MWAAVLAQFGIFVEDKLLPDILNLFVLPVADDLLKLAATWITDLIDPVTTITLMARMLAGIAKDGNGKGYDAQFIADDQFVAARYLLSDSGAPADDAHVKTAMTLAEIKNWVAGGFPAPAAAPAAVTP